MQKDTKFNLQPPKMTHLRKLNYSQRAFTCSFTCSKHQNKVRNQARNQKFSRARKFSWNQGTSINNHLLHKKEKPPGKNLWFFSLESLKNCTLNEKFHPQMTIIKAFLPKIRALFSNSRKRAWKTSPPPPSSYAPGNILKVNKKNNNDTICVVLVSLLLTLNILHLVLVFLWLTLNK